MNHSHRYFAATSAVFLILQFMTVQSASATKTVKPKGQGHKFGLGWFKKSNGVHKNGYSKSYHNPNWVNGKNNNHGQGSPKHN